MRNFASCSPGFFPPKVQMAANSRNRPMPAWILLPVGAAAAVAVLITWGSGSLLLGLITALVGALAAAWWCEQMLRGVAGTIAQIAGGDRYAALPERIGSGALGDSAVAAEADAAGFDRCRRAGGRSPQPRGGNAAAPCRPQLLHPALSHHRRQARRRVSVRGRGNPGHRRRSRRAQRRCAPTHRACGRCRHRGEPRRRRGCRRRARAAWR